MNFRPPSWGNPYRYPDGNGNYYTRLEMDKPDDAYEAGADAMLEAITLGLFEKRLTIKRRKGCLEIVANKEKDD